MKVTKLSEQDEAQLEVYRDKWISIGLSIETFSQKECEKIVSDLYKHILQKPKPKIEIKDSPFSLWKYIESVVGKNMSFCSSYFCGSFDAYIFSFYDYMINQLKVNIDKDLLFKLHIWQETVKLGPIYPFDDICLVSKKPIKIVRKDNQLHNDNGPSIEYCDGFCLYHLNGVKMDKEYVMTPWNKLDPKLILKEQNAEIRRELVRKIGIERIVDKLGAKTLDSKGDYELLQLNLGDKRKRPYLKMKNPSIGVYHIEGVHPDCKTVDDAIKFRNGTNETPVVLS